MALASEMPADFHLEALKAQGVAALSYALYQAKLHRAQPLQELLGADFAADPDHRSGYMTQESAEEFYGDQFAVSWKKLTEAADAAANYVMLYEGEPIAAAYHAISCGMTEASENIWISSLPYLQAVDSSWDILASGYRSKVEISGEEFRTRMEEEEITLKGTAGEWIEVMETSASGYVICVRVGDREMTGLQLRDLLGLRSACFTLVPSGANLTFEVRGYGHGAGLSQNGADYLARQGWDFERILKHYYTGVELARLQNY